MRKILYLTNKYSNNPGNSALLGGVINLVTEIIGNHKYEIFDLDKLSYQTITEDNFINLCNSFDYCIVAGPIIFNGQIHYSKTGSKINISLNSLRNIKSKFILFGVSTRIWPSEKYHHLNKLKEFIDFTENQKNWFFLIRDDGSLNALNKVLSQNLDLPTIADPALFSFTERKKEETKNANALFINLNGEDFKNRYGNKYLNFLKNISNSVEELIQTDKYKKLVLQPHGPDDLEILSNLSSLLSPKIRHKYLEFGALPREDFWKEVYEKYKKECKNLITMRIHSLSPSIAMGIGTHIIHSSERIKYLSESLSHESLFSSYDDPDLFKRIISGFPSEKLIEESINRINKMKKDSINSIMKILCL